MLQRIETAGWYRNSAREKKQAIESNVESTLCSIAARDGEPDNWERFHIAAALNGAHIGTLDLAWTHACLAAVPKSDIARKELVPDLPELMHLSLWVLTERLRMTRRLPARLFNEIVAA